MADGPFKSMTPDNGSNRPAALAVMKCDRCHGWIYTGDWPLCRGAVVDHKR